MHYSFPIKIIIGLGNPGPAYYKQRHNIGFRIVNALAEKYNGIWKLQGNMEVARLIINDIETLLIKPQTFMNNSGAVLSTLLRHGVKVENLLIVHDELEKPFGAITLKLGGSHKGHNGLRSIIGFCGDKFLRLRFGVGRPAHKEAVPIYVLAPFEQAEEEVGALIDQSVMMIEGLFAQRLPL
jgi:PTH1 family peptidyl-tRNA hydrolase